jgi:hypothetical protein
MFMIDDDGQCYLYMVCGLHFDVDNVSYQQSQSITNMHSTTPSIDLSYNQLTVRSIEALDVIYNLKQLDLSGKCIVVIW